MRARRMRQRRARVGARWRRRKTARPPDRIAYPRRRAPRGARVRLHLSRILYRTVSTTKTRRPTLTRPPRPSRPSPDPTGTAMTDVTAATTPLVGAFDKIKESAMHVVGRVRAGEAVPA